MDILLFEPEYFNRHYNCSFYDYHQIPADVREHKLVGVCFLVGYLVFAPPYALCVWAMCSSANRQIVTYRIMIVLGVIHIVGLHGTGLTNGLFAINGVVFCSNPLLNYLTTLVGIGVWTSSSTLSVILGFNRCSMLFSQRLHETLFGGYRLVPWLVAPIVYALWIMIFTPPIFYNSIYVGYFFNPHLAYYEDPTDFYHNTPNKIHNTCICFFETFVYALMVTLYKRSTQNMTAENKLKTRFDRQIYVQVMLVGLTSIVASGVYLILMNFPVPIATSLVGTVFYHLSQGMPGIVYVCFNQTIRTTIAQRFRRMKGGVGNGGSTVTQVQSYQT